MSAPCPICRQKQAQETYKPFCSKRCADVDLNRWMSGGYAIATETPDDTQFESPESD